MCLCLGPIRTVEKGSHGTTSIQYVLPIQRSLYWTELKRIFDIVYSKSHLLLPDNVFCSVSGTRARLVSFFYGYVFILFLFKSQEPIYFFFFSRRVQKKMEDCTFFSVVFLAHNSPYRLFCTVSHGAESADKDVFEKNVSCALCFATALKSCGQQKSSRAPKGMATNDLEESTPLGV